MDGNRNYGNVVDPTARLITLQRSVSVELRDVVHVGRDDAAFLAVKE
jgi:hypothetical protein